MYCYRAEVIKCKKDNIFTLSIDMGFGKWKIESMALEGYKIKPDRRDWLVIQVELIKTIEDGPPRYWKKTYTGKVVKHARDSSPQRTEAALAK